MRLETLPDADRQAAKVPADGMALLVKGVGKYNLHATAHKAGVKEGDIIVAYDGKTDFEREADVFWYVVSQKQVGDQVTFKVLREGKPLVFSIPLQP